jgi:tyrocidine synthetase III
MKKEILKEQKNIAAEQNVKEEGFWMDLFSDGSPRSFFPFTSSHAADIKPEDPFGITAMTLSENLGRRILDTCKSSDYKLHLFFSTALVVLLEKYSIAQDRFMIGTPIYNPDIEGQLINTMLPLIVPVSTGDTFKQMLQRVGKSMVDASNHQNFPMEILFNRLGLPLSTREVPYIDTVIMLDNIQDSRYIDDVEAKIIFIFSRRDEKITCNLRFHKAYYDEETAKRLLAHFQQLLLPLVENLDSPVSHLPVLDDPEQTIVNVNDGPRLQSQSSYQSLIPVICKRFEYFASQKPDTVAAVFENRSLTYGQLNRSGNRLARVLMERGIVKGNMVAIAVEPCPEVIVAIIAVLKTGAICLPVSPDGPEESNGKVVRDNKVKILLTREHFNLTPGDLFSSFTPGNIIFLDDPSQFNTHDTNLNIEILPHDPALVIYTSGTTGVPRGVLLDHNSIVCMQQGLESFYAQPPARVALVTLFMSGMSLKQLFGVLLAGHSLYLFPDATFPQGDALIDFYNRNAVDVSDGTPYHIGLLTDSMNLRGIDCTVKQFIVGGEILSKQLVNHFLACFSSRKPKITNTYGAVECDDCVLSYDIDPECLESIAPIIPLGKPLPGIDAYVLGRDNRLQPVGVPGNLAIAGNPISCGYLNDTEATEAVFIQNPFNVGQKLYLTGDLSYRGADGSLHFLGRGGELNDISRIETLLHRHGDVDDCYVVPKNLEDGHFCAYIVDFQTSDAPVLEDYLRACLPTDYFPIRFQAIQQLPITANFKIDRKHWLETRVSSETAEKVIIPPRTPVEKILLEMWADVLEIDEDTISIDSNFLDLNGNSLRTIMLISKIYKEFDVRIPIVDVFKDPTITGLADHIKDSESQKFVPLVAVEEKEYYELSSAQKRLYIVQQLDPNTIGYNISVIRMLDFPIAKDRFSDTFKQLVNRHESLRTSFQLVNNRPVQRINREVAFEVEYRDISGNPGEIGNAFIYESIGELIRPFDLENAPLCRVGLICLAEDKQVLVFDMHHIITDAITGNEFSSEFITLYNGGHLPPLKLQYKDYSEWQNSESRKVAIRRQEDFWVEEFAGDVPLLNLPTDFARPALQSFAGDTVKFRFEPERSKKLRALAVEEDTTMFILFLTLCNILLAKITNQDDIVIGTGTAGRVHPDLEHILGIFINTVALRNYINQEWSFKEFLEDVTAKTLNAFENQEYQFEDLVNKIIVEPPANRNPLFDVAITYNTEDFQSTSVSMDNPDEINYENKISKFDMSFFGEESGDRVYFSFEYCTALFKREKIERFTRYFEDIVTAVLDNRDIILKDIDISHGFSELKTDLSQDLQGDFHF